MDSIAMGKLVLPAMEKLPARLQHLQAAVLCTEDGFNVCSIGVGEEQLGKMAALSSSLLTIGQATVQSLASGSGASSLDVLSLQSADWTIVGVRVPHPSQPLVLMLSARNTPLGVLHLSARQACEDIVTRLGAPRAAVPA